MSVFHRTLAYTDLIRPKVPRFTADDADRAHDAWGANCGPAAIAALLDLTLDQVRPHLGEFERKRYMNPSMVWQALGSLGADWMQLGDARGWPCYGICRVQWDGPWCGPSVPPTARYRYTHWIGARTHPVQIFDINALNAGGWLPLADWAGIIVPTITAAIPRANGRWSVIDVAEITGRARGAAA